MAREIKEINASLKTDLAFPANPSKFSWLYGPIITTYFFSQIVIICFIIYVIIDLGLSIMSTLALMILVQTSILLYMVTSTASRVHEEATLGFDSLRTASMKNLGFREEKVLRALLTSFGGPSVYMTGSKMFNIHRPTILTIFSNIATYFVVLFQIIRYWDWSGSIFFWRGKP